MKARINGWRIEADVTRNLGSNPHTVDVVIEARSPRLGGVHRFAIELSATDAGDLAVLLDDLQHRVDRASEAGECEHCSEPCDPGETYCPGCEERRAG